MCSNEESDSALLDDDDVVAIATWTCLGDIKFNLHSAWYLASAACKSFTAPSTSIHTSGNYLSPCVWHVLRISCFISISPADLSPTILYKNAPHKPPRCCGWVFFKIA